MYLKNIYLDGFRNYEKQSIDFINGINLFIGDNAQGKTNIIEAIYLSAFAKSYRTLKENEMINFKESYLRVQLRYNKKNNDKITDIYIDKNNNKIIKQDEIKISKVSSIIGEILLVIFSPDDLDIVKGSPSSRRKFLDMICCQISKSYMINLQEYNKILKLKNSLLKKYVSNEEKEYIYILHEKMSELIEKIVLFRTSVASKILEKAINIHYTLTNNKEKINIKYISEFIGCNKNKIKEILDNNLQIDIFRKTSLKGVQRDDLEIYINNLEVIKYGSQGQSRTSLLTLKLANFEVLKELKEEDPILLLDDIMSELDKNRIEFLLKYIEKYQSIITTTEFENFKNISNIKIRKIINGHLQSE